MLRMVWLMAAVWMAAGVPADDWYSWRGPNRNGISSETGWNPKSIKNLWTAELGLGHSTVAVKDGRLYTMGNIDDKDMVYCLDARTGKEIWKHTYDCKAGNYPGPRSTPVADGDAVYTISREGLLFCFDAATGKVKWKTDVNGKTGLEVSRWGIASSPVIEGNLILLNIGATGVAVEKADGKIAWHSKSGTGSYAAAVLFDHKGKRCAAVFSADGLYVVEAAGGKELSSYTWKTKYDVHGADPLVIGDRIFISSGYDHGCAMLDFSSGKLEKLWESDVLRAQFSSAVHIDGFIYGIDGQTKKKGFLRCIDAADGAEKWSMPIGFGSLIAADGKLIALGEDGQLHIAEAVPGSYKQISKTDTGLVEKEELCWTPPVLSNGIIYCRNDKGRLVAFAAGK